MKSNIKTSGHVRLLIGACVALFTCALASPLAQAQATRTWVSGVGDDANPCSRTAPGKTFAGAISKTAAGGEISVLDPGGFGVVTITKSITINGEGTLAGILSAGATGVIINAGASGVVTLRKLSINGVGTGINGIRILQAAEVNIEDCVISEVTTLGIDINQTTSPCRVNIKNTIISGCGTGAVHSRPTAGGAVVVNVVNSSMLNSQFGFRADSSATATLEDCVISGNTNSGVAVNASGATAGVVGINRCTITDNNAGVASQFANSIARISDTTITKNTTGVVATSSGQVISFGNNRIQGNTTNGTPTSTTGLQ